MDSPSFDEMNELLRYEPETGRLFWKPRPRSLFPNDRLYRSWNSANSEKEALTALTAGGYRHGSFRGKFFLAHRVAWLLAKGRWPDGLLDHIDRNKLNNRICNLREASKALNAINSKMSRRNTSGVRGVSWDKKNRQWQVRIKVDSKVKFLGRFDTIKEAGDARKEAIIKLGLFDHPLT